MRLDSRSGLRGLLINRDTRQPIRWVRWAEIPEDPEAPGEFEAFLTEPQAYRARGLPLSDILYRGRARLRFIPAAPRFGPRPTSARELYESLDDARRSLVRRLEPPAVLIPGVVPIHECEVATCHQPAWWLVSDEREIEPQRDAEGREHERAVTVAAHYFCDRHFRLPTVVSRRGVESEVETETRPQ